MSQLNLQLEHYLLQEQELRLDLIKAKDECFRLETTQAQFDQLRSEVIVLNQNQHFEQIKMKEKDILFWSLHSQLQDMESKNQSLEHFATECDEKLNTESSTFTSQLSSLKKTASTLIGKQTQSIQIIDIYKKFSALQTSYQKLKQNHQTTILLFMFVLTFLGLLLTINLRFGSNMKISLSILIFRFPLSIGGEKF